MSYLFKVDSPKGFLWQDVNVDALKPPAVFVLLFRVTGSPLELTRACCLIQLFVISLSAYYSKDKGRRGSEEGSKNLVRSR